MIQMNPKIIAFGTTLLLVLIFLAVVVAPRYINPESDQP